MYHMENETLYWSCFVAKMLAFYVAICLVFGSAWLLVASLMILACKVIMSV
jgi:hypothetical protein